MRSLLHERLLDFDAIRVTRVDKGRTSADGSAVLQRATHSLPGLLSESSALSGGRIRSVRVTEVLE
jgi:hypothetical protein